MLFLVFNYYDCLQNMAARGRGRFSFVNIGNLVRETNLANVVVFPLILGRFLRRCLCILIDFATIRIGLSIICFKGSQVDFPNKYVLQSLNIAFIIANSADHDEMQH